MDNSDKNQFASIMAGISEIYDKPVSTEKMRIYFATLQSYSIEDVREGFNKHIGDINHGTFFPKPADVIRQIQGKTVDCSTRAELAWMEVENAIRAVGSYGNLNMEDKQALAAVKSLGSWKDLCMTDVDKMQWKKKQFIEAYETFENTPVEMLPHKLPGITEMHNQKLESKSGMKSLMDGINEYRARNGIEKLDG